MLSGHTVVSAELCMWPEATYPVLCVCAILRTYRPVPAEPLGHCLPAKHNVHQLSKSWPMETMWYCLPFQHTKILSSYHKALVYSLEFCFLVISCSIYLLYCWEESQVVGWMGKPPIISDIGTLAPHLVTLCWEVWVGQWCWRKSITGDGLCDEKPWAVWRVLSASCL